jgi:hypothetical protein
MNNKSFIEKLQGANVGKKGMYIGAATLAAIVVIKLFIAPLLQPYFANSFWKTFKQILSICESVIMIYVFAFFLCIVFMRNTVGGKIVYAMQLQDKSYFKDKWILWWLKSIFWSFVLLGITTVLQQSFFKSWMSFFYLCFFISIPFFIMPRLQKMQQNRFK